MATREPPAVGNLSDRALVEAFQGGDERAYDELYRRYSDRVRRTCSRMLRDPRDVEEAVQETFLRAFRALPRFNGEFQVRAWLVRIASNVSLDLIRSRTKAPTLVALPEETVESGDGPEDIIVGGNERVSSTIDDLQPLHKEALVLRAVEGMSHREMAGRLAMSPQQVKALLHRARTSFKRAWKRAGGWLVAPAALMRTSWDESPRGSSPGLLSVSPGVAPMLAEKVTASAVVVAVALTSLPQSGAEPTPAPPGGGAIAQQRTSRDAGPAVPWNRAPRPHRQTTVAKAEAQTDRDQPRRTTSEAPAVATIVQSSNERLQPRDNTEAPSTSKHGDVRQSVAAEIVNKVRELPGPAKDLVARS